MKISLHDFNTQNDKWLAWAIETAREYAPDRLDAFIEANGFKPEHEKAIREAVLQ